MTGPIWQQLASTLAGSDASPTTASIRETTTGLLSRDAAWILAQAFEKADAVRWSEIAAAMVAVDCLAGDTAPLTEIIWTGPANNRFPVRRIDQVLYDLISQSQSRVVLVTFAAHRIRHLCTHLMQAVERGIELTLIVESEDESEGQLTHDAIDAFRDIPHERMQIYYWPLRERERNQAGRPGKLHMKCAIVDDAALIGSANLTDDAFNRNMELGMLVRDKSTVDSLSEHFTELIRAKILVPVDQMEVGHR